MLLLPASHIHNLRNDFEGQAVLINCLLRNYLHYNLYNQVTTASPLFLIMTTYNCFVCSFILLLLLAQADKLVLKCNFPEQASNNEWAR